MNQIDQKDLEEDLKEQYAILEQEINEDKKKKRFLVVFIFFAVIFLIMFGTTFSYFRLLKVGDNITENTNLLKKLYFENSSNDIDFKPGVYSYYISFPKGTTSVDLGYELVNDNYKITITGDKDLKPGINEIKVVVTDDSGKSEEYIIYVEIEEDTPKPTPEIIPSEINIGLKNLLVSNHSLNKTFNTKTYTYATDDIKNGEDSLNIIFALVDDSNSFKIKLNGYEVVRKPEKDGNSNYILNLNVATELVVGANDLEIIVNDSNGNSVKYNLILNLLPKNDEQQIVEINVIYNDNKGEYKFDNIIPGWISSDKQLIEIINKSNYDTAVDIDWTNVLNNFTNNKDLEYKLYYEYKVIKTGTLPKNDTNLITNLEIKANSDNKYYLEYSYKYSDQDQNVDQGKSFSTIIRVSLSK